MWGRYSGQAISQASLLFYNECMLAEQGSRVKFYPQGNLVRAAVEHSG